MKEILTKTIHLSDSRGHANYGWLDTYHSFSFARYHNPDRMNFGLLRVLNDDIVQPGMGFGTHPHDNMEIVSIPLSGDLEHKDSTGHIEIIKKNDIQIMSAGSGVTHSEYNHSSTNVVNFLQIWVLPDKLNITPRYDQHSYSPEKRKNQLQCIVSPDKRNDSLWINQDAYMSLSDLDVDKNLTYQLNNTDHGIYIFVIEGKTEILSEALNRRDAIGLSGISGIEVTAKTDSQLLFIEVPMI